VQKPPVETPEPVPPVVQTPEAPPAVPADADAVVADVAFQPMFQVDGFAWAERATSLRLAAGIQVDRLADSLVDGAAEGRKVAAIGGCRRCQGCTTLLLCAAKRLADRGVKVAVVDADFAHPALAARLGLLPEFGLEAVIGGRSRPEEAAIESATDKMTLLPVAAPCRKQADAPQGQAALAATIDLLRKSYDLVLVDLGEIAAGAQPDAAGRCVPAWVDAVVLVQDIRSTPQADLVRTAQRIQSEGIAQLGVVENFV
jgi:Mrp family chromosome partitioning ATPase